MKYKAQPPVQKALLQAAIDIRDDLLVRAEVEPNGAKVVARGCGAWIRLNAAIDAAEKQS